jgi:Ca-activated chloride channel family protein
MYTRRIQLLAAGALLLATALAGAAARGKGPSAAPPGPMPVGGAHSFAAPPAGGVMFTGTLDRSAVLLGKDGTARIELAIAAAADEARHSARRPTDLVIILDRSGSMSGDKIEHARAAVRELIAQLGVQDRFALVTYADDAVVTIPLTEVDPRRNTAWMSAISEIQPDGSTNMAAGLDLALSLVDSSRSGDRVPHVILISDGLANVGDASPAGLTRRAQCAARGEYMLSAIGVGADFNEQLMSALADAGTGNYYYVQNTRDLGGIFAREFDAARTTVATGLAVRIEPADGVQVLDAAGYPLERDDRSVVFRPGSLFAGQERRIWVTLSVPHDAVGTYDIGRFTLSYGNAGAPTALSFSEVPRIACVADDAEFYAGLDAPAWARAVTIDAYNQMQADVAREVKLGERDKALARLRAFKDEIASMNARVQSAPVAAQLRSADELEARVSSAFEGPGQAERQNALSKSAGAAAVDARRAGSKK